jgi:hypothetical protein
MFYLRFFSSPGFSMCFRSGQVRSQVWNDQSRAEMGLEALRECLKDGAMRQTSSYPRRSALSQRPEGEGRCLKNGRDS